MTDTTTVDDDAAAGRRRRRPATTSAATPTRDVAADEPLELADGIAPERPAQGPAAAPVPPALVLAIVAVALWR